MQTKLTSPYLALAAILITVIAIIPPAPSSIPTYAPLPPTAIGPQISGDVGFRIQELGVGAYLLTDGLYQALFLISCEGVILVDAPPTIGENLLKGIRSVTDLPVTHVVYSHAHSDHIGAAYLFNGSNVNFVAHYETMAELAFAPDHTTRPTPTMTFQDKFEIRACNQTLQLSYKGPNHEPGNIFIYAPLQKVLMLVDIVYPGWVPFDQLGESQNIPGFIKAHDQILEYDFDYYLGGHINRVGTRQDVLIQQEYVNDLYSNCVEAIRLSGESANASNPLSIMTALLAIQEANPFNYWAIFDYYINTLLADWVANKTEEKWVGVLGGTDVYTWSNAVAMLEPVRISYGMLGPYGVHEG